MPGQREAGHLSHNPESSSQDLLWCSIVSQQDTSFQPVSGPRGTGPCHLVQPLPVTLSLLAPSLITCSCPHSPVGSAHCPHLGEETGPAAGGLQPKATHPGACLLTDTVAGRLSCCYLSKTGLGKCPELQEVSCGGVGRTDWGMFPPIPGLIPSSQVVLLPTQ